MNFRVKNNIFCGSHRKSSSAGFTLIEFLVAMAMFIVLGGAVFEMFAKQAPSFGRQQNLAGVNIAIQNAVSQMQLDLVNAGTGYYPGLLISSWPIGVTVVNQPAGAPACNNSANFTYSSSCFDTLNILTINPNIPASHPTSGPGSPTPNCSTVDSSPFYLQPNVITGDTLAQELTATAAGFSVGDQVLLITTGGGTHSTTGPTGGNTYTASSGTLVNSFVITGAPVIGANYVALPFNAISPTAYAAGSFSTNDPGTNDQLNISNVNSTNLGGAFCSADWVMKLEPTTYSINDSNPQDPILQRSQNGQVDNIAEQIIGFKVGAATWNSTQNTSTLTYSFFAPNALNGNPSGYGSDFQLVRSVRVTLIGRTNPNPDPSYTFRNAFDGGPYQVVNATVVINPRNLTMNGN
jgi:prepilin-type N-terminal cleavage/methylation domain-containing protein